MAPPPASYNEPAGYQADMGTCTSDVFPRVPGRRPVPRKDIDRPDMPNVVGSPMPVRTAL